MKKTQRKWLNIFERFIGDLRIQSKEVVAVDERGAPLEMWGTQRYYLQELCAGLDDGVRDFRTLKGRQQGISTISAAICLFWLAFYRGTIAAFVADSDSNKKVFRELMQRYLASFPPDYFGGDFQVIKGKDNAHFTSFSNGSRLDYLSAGTRGNKSLGESRGYNFALCTEVANYGDASGLASFQETLATDHPNRLFLNESTAKSFNHWYFSCKEAEDHPLTMRFIFIGWWRKELNRIARSSKRFQAFGLTPPNGDEIELITAVHDRYGYVITPEQLAWYREKYSQAESTDKIADLEQNQPWLPEQAFIKTGRLFFQTRLLQQRIDDIRATHLPWFGYRYIVGNDFFAMKIERIEERARRDEVTLRVWEEPVETGFYAIGCDPAYGRSEDSDFSAISVWRCYADKLVQVAEFADRRTETHQLAWILAHLAAAYENCEIIIELTGPGRVVKSQMDAVRLMLRSDLYAEQVNARGWEDALGMARSYIYRRIDALGSKGHLTDFETNWSRKREIMNQLRDSHSSGQLIPNSVALIEEMGHMVQAHSDIAPSGEGSNDDRVFAAALANRAWVDNIRLGLIVNGRSFAAVRQEEEALTAGGSDAPRIIRHQVYNFFKTMDERLGYDDDEGLAAYMRVAERR